MSNLVSLLASFGPWSWFIFAVGLFTLEMIVPGVHFLWFGVAAIATGALALATGITWPFQLLAFGALAVATVFWVRRFVRPDVAVSDLPDLNARGRSYIGRSVLVEVPIENGRGKVRVGDTLWSAEGPDTPAGARVRVTGARGIVLTVDHAAA
ncbi:MAG: NfeD family protein [Hyphomicrobiaceae bacterium]|nr:NfeD family protein [Hyphomicrobiaceae bacterium]